MRCPSLTRGWPTEAGSMLLKKQGRELQVLIDFTKPDAKTVAFRGQKAEIFYPKLKTVQEYDLGKQRGMVDQFLLLGFGTTGQDLKANYSVKYAGEETVAAAHAARALLSGPAAGVVGAGRVAKLAGIEHALAFDRGGTATGH